MLFERQKRLLALVDALGGEVGNLDFQKLLFLYCAEIEEMASRMAIAGYKGLILNTSQFTVCAAR